MTERIHSIDASKLSLTAAVRDMSNADVQDVPKAAKRALYIQSVFRRALQQGNAEKVLQSGSILPLIVEIIHDDALQEHAERVAAAKVGKPYTEEALSDYDTAHVEMYVAEELYERALKEGLGAEVVAQRKKDFDQATHVVRLAGNAKFGAHREENLN